MNVHPSALKHGMGAEDAAHAAPHASDEPWHVPPGALDGSDGDVPADHVSPAGPATAVPPAPDPARIPVPPAERQPALGSTSFILPHYVPIAHE